MRILIIHQFFLGRSDSGGSRWNQFAKYWAAAGHDVTVLAGMVHYAKGTKPPEYKGKFIVREQVGPRVTVLRCHVSESYNRNFMGRFWAYLSFTFSSLIAGILYAPKPDVIIATSPPLTVAPAMWLLGVLLGSPTVFEVRDLWPESAVDTGVLTSKPLIWLSYRIEALAYRRAALINLLTPAFVEALITRKGVSPHRLCMIPNAADLDLMRPGPRDNHVRTELGLEGKFVISYFGAHGRANRIGQLLDAAELLKTRCPEAVILLVGDGMEKPMLVEQAAQRKLDNVIFAPPVSKEQVGDYINASDVCTAVLMKNETFKTVYPNKVFDYMCCKRPIIIGIDGAARKLIEAQARAGLFAEPENPQAFVEAVLTLKNDPDRAAGMGQSGWEYVVEHFDREKLAARYLGEIAAMLKRCGS